MSFSLPKVQSLPRAKPLPRPTLTARILCQGSVSVSTQQPAGEPHSPLPALRTPAPRGLPRLFFAFLAAFAVLAGPVLTASFLPTLPEAAAGTSTSTNGDFTLTKTASKTVVATGGERVTYTYTVKNNRGCHLYFVSNSDDKCSPLSNQSGLSSGRDWTVGKEFYWIPANGTATWTCSQLITYDTTNTATFDFARGYDSYWTGPITWYNRSSATTTETVRLQSSTGGTCEASTLWYVSDILGSNTDNSTGTVGTLNPSSRAASPKSKIRTATRTSTFNGWPGSAAVSVDPKSPHLVYEQSGPQWTKSYRRRPGASRWRPARAGTPGAR